MFIKWGEICSKEAEKMAFGWFIWRHMVFNGREVNNNPLMKKLETKKKRFLMGEFQDVWLHYKITINTPIQQKDSVVTAK